MSRYKKFFLGILLTCVIILAGSCAFADVTLYRGTQTLGSVMSVEDGANTLVPIEDTGLILGFSFSRSSEELLLRRGSENLRVVLNSAAAWRGFAIIPLYSAPVERDGKFWLDTQSAAALFQSSVGLARTDRLRFAKSSAYVSTRVTARSASELDFGNTDEEQKQPAKIPEPVIAQRTQTQTQTQTPISNPNTNPNPTPAPTPVKKQTQSQPVAKSSAKSQPRMQTFTPNDAHSTKSASYSGNLQSVRWSSVNSGSHKRIRAVVDTDENSDPQVELVNANELQLFFAASSGHVDGVPSPYENVKSEIKPSSTGTILAFTTSRYIKIEKMTLSSPRRIVLDFYFAPEVAILNSTNNTTVAQTPQASIIPPTPPAPQLTIPNNPDNSQAKTQQKPDPAININLPQTTRTKPAYTGTPPSEITIPLTPTATSNQPRRNRNGRRTVVVDPGHGGKDPGTSANGLTEKNVNLSIGLLLERELKSRGLNVIMTRRTDVYLKLQERTDIANNSDADLFVSVHVNALPARKTTAGFEIYIMALPTDKDALNLAKIENREYVEGKGVDVANVDRRTEMLLRILGDMQQNNKISESTDFAAALFQAGRRENLPMKRVAQAPFFVIRGAGMPAVLLETGFCTNPNEARLLLDTSYQQRIARAMANGIMNYLN